jgi:hypothetical protein
VLVKPKSKAGIRVVEIPAPLVPLVAAHLETLHGLPNPLDLVFPSEAGTPLDPKNVRRRHFVPATQALGVFHYYHRWRTISRWPWTALRSALDNHLSKARWSPSRQWVDSIATMSGWRRDLLRVGASPNRAVCVFGKDRGYGVATMVAELRGYLLGWKAYFRLADTPGVFTALDQWLRRWSRMVYLKQWKRGPTAFRELRARGVPERVAAQAASHACRWWRTATQSSGMSGKPTPVPFRSVMVQAAARRASNLFARVTHLPRSTQGGEPLRGPAHEGLLRPLPVSAATTLPCRRHRSRAAPTTALVGST